MLYGKDGKGTPKPKPVSNIGGFEVHGTFTDYKRYVDIDISDRVAARLENGEVVEISGLKFKPIGNGKYRVYNLIK
jgi:hypothetical protein